MISRAGFVWLLLGLIWGSSFIFIKVSTDAATPMQIALVRTVSGFVIVAAYAAWRRQLRFSHLRYGLHFIAMAMFTAVLHFYCYAQGGARLASGLAGAISASIPLFALVGAALFLPEEKLTPQGVFGFLIGLLGVTLIAKPFAGNGSENALVGALWMLLGSISFSASFVYARRFVTPLALPPAALATYQLGFAAVILFILTDTNGLSTVYVDPNLLGTLVVGLGLLGTGLAYVLYYYVVEHLGAVRASALTYVPPVVALFLGAFFLNEAIGVVGFSASALIFAGVALANKATSSRL